MTVARSAPVPASATIGSTLAALTRTLAAAGIEFPRLEARLLLGAAIDRPADSLVGRLAEPFDAAAGQRLDSLLRRRLAGEPTAYLLGYREFWSLPFAVGPAVLIPRPDSETVVEAALRWLDARRLAAPRILDLGCGSGCLMLSLLHERPAAQGVGIDRSAAAVEIARSNAERLGLADRAVFLVGNWTDAVAGGFDLILCNPPYIADDDLARLPSTIAAYEPRLALAGGADGLSAYRRIVPGLVTLLRRDGRAIFEIGCRQAAAVAALAAAHQLQLVDIKNDLGGRPRALLLAAMDNRDR